MNSQNKILLLGEAWGEQEAEAKQAFVGKSGWLLKQLLTSVGLRLEDCYTTNVFNLRPEPTNDIVNLCGKKVDAIPGMPALTKDKFVRAEYLPELTRLYNEINRVNPNVILALGATAVWALTASASIRSTRGSVSLTAVPSIVERAAGVTLNREFKFIPTYHPAAVLREWSLRPIVIADLTKLKRHSASPIFARPQRLIWVEPSLEDLALYERDYIVPAERLSIDIETKQDQITCVGFAPSPHTAIVVPFWAQNFDKGNYWPTLESELKAWEYVRRWCGMKPSVFQNGMYDIHRLWRTYGISCTQAAEDTMLLHHALQPEMEKGLGFLGTLYTDEASWKFMRKTETLKKED